MKISLIGPVTPYRGGIAHFTTLLGKKLIAAGHDVQVISFKKQYPAWLYPGESDKDHSPEREKVDAEFLLTPLNPFSWRKTARAIALFQPEQVILPWWVTFWGPAFHHIINYLKRQGIFVTILIHNTMPHEPRLWDRALARRTLKEADRFIVMTIKEKNRLLTLLPETENVQIAPLPIYHAFKKSKLEKVEIREKLNLPTTAPIIMFFGFIRPYKGLHVLIEAFKILIKNNSKTHLIIVGEFWEDKNPYLTHIDRLGLGENIHIFDAYIPDDEISEFFKAADVFAAPYIGGTQSAAVKTALGFGLPSVATDIITDRFLQSVPQRCLIVPAGDAVRLSEGIKKQIKLPVQNEIQIERMVERSWEQMLDVAILTPPSSLASNRTKKEHTAR